MPKSREEVSENRYGFLSNVIRKELEAPTLDFVHGQILHKVGKLLGNVQRACSLKPDNSDNQAAAKILSQLVSAIDSIITPTATQKTTVNDEIEDRPSFKP